jgi:hypothetical protein
MLNQKDNYPSCSLCHSADIKPRKGSVRDNKSLRILECQNCGLVFLSSQEHIQTGFYEKQGMFANSGNIVTGGGM